jgi:hypothetical protein
MKMFNCFITILLLCVIQEARARELPISTAPEHQLRPAIASSGDNYLVVWQDDRSASTGTDIWGRIVTINGDPLDSFPICTQPDYQASPAVAWGGDNYLVIWEDRLQKIYGQLVDENGNLVGISFLIGENLNSPYEAGNDVASNGTNYLVVWTTSPADIAGRMVSNTGSPIGPAFTVSSAADSQFFPQTISVGSNYLVAWPDKRTGNWNIYGQGVASDGSLIGTNFSISSKPKSERRIALASNDSCLLVAWEQSTSIITGWDIYGTIFDSTMSVLAFDVAISGAMWDQRLSCACWHSATSRFIVGWQDYRGASTANIWIRGIETDGTLDAEQQITSLPVEQRQPDIACSRICFLIVWEDYREGASDIDIYGYIPPPCPVEEVSCQLTMRNGQLSIYPNPFIHNTVIQFGVRSSQPEADEPLTQEFVDGETRHVMSLQMKYFQAPISFDYQGNHGWFKNSSSYSRTAGSG